MSPSESQLRAALQDGEGDAPDAGLLISHAVRVRYDRRRRITSIAGGVGVIAVVGVGLTALVSSGSDTEKAGGSSGGRAASGYSQNDKAAGGAKAPSAQGSSAAASSARPTTNPAAAGGKIDALNCPATPARYLLPGGGGSGQFGSRDPLFASPVATVKACGYPQSSGAKARSAIYRGTTAAKIVSVLGSAPNMRTSASCTTDYVGGTIEILAVDAKGNALKPVVVTLNCVSSQATNGTAVRYVNVLPDELTRLVH